MRITERRNMTSPGVPPVPPQVSLRIEKPPLYLKILAGVVITLALLVISGSVAAVAVASTGNELTQTCTVEDKRSSDTQDGPSIYWVYTDCGITRVSANVFKNVSTPEKLYSDIEVGETYDFTTVGYHLPLLSMFPSVIEVS